VWLLAETTSRPTQLINLEINMLFGRISQIGRNFVTSAARRSGGHDHGGIPGGVRIAVINKQQTLKAKNGEPYNFPMCAG
jgi:hypothetical protein